MANGLIADWEQENRSGVIDRIEIYKDGYGGSSTNFGGRFSFSHREVTSSQDSILNPYANRIMMGVLDWYPFVDSSAKDTIIKDMADGDSVSYRVIWKRDNQIWWNGYISGNVFTYPEKSRYTAHVQFKDFEILQGLEYAFDDTRQTIITTFADIFSQLDFVVPGSPGVYPGIKTVTSWQEQNTTITDDFLNQVYHDTFALREYGRNGDESDTEISYYDALLHASESALIVSQKDGYFWIEQISGHEDPSVSLLSEYDNDGIQQSSTATDMRQTGYTSASSGTPSVKIISNNETYPAIKKALVSYKHRSLLSGIQIPSTVNILAPITISITAASTASDYIEIANDYTSIFGPGSTFSVTGSTGNDGDYTVVSASLSGGNTQLFTVEEVPSDVGDGFVNTDVATPSDSQYSINFSSSGDEYVIYSATFRGIMLVGLSGSPPVGLYALRAGSYFWDATAAEWLSPGSSSATRFVSFGTGGVDTGTNEINIAHGFRKGEIVRFSTTGTLPSGLSADTDYYILYVDSTTFQVSTSYEGSAVTLTTTGTGTHTATSITNLVTLSLSTTIGDANFYDGTVSFQTGAIPSGISDEIELTYFPSVHGGSGGTWFYSTLILDSQLQIVDPTVSSGTSLDYSLTQSASLPTKFEYGDVWYGDGPYAYSRSSFRYSTTLEEITTGWRRRGGSTYYPYAQLLLTEFIDVQRTRTRKLRAEINGDYDPTKILVYDGNNYMYTGGTYDGWWHVTLIRVNIQTGSDTFEEIVKTDPTGSQGQVVTVPGASGITQSAGDARYLRQSLNLSDLDSASTARTNLDVYSTGEADAAFQPLDAELTTLSGLTSGEATAIVGVTETQWGLVANMDQDVDSMADVEFNSVTSANLTAGRLPYVGASGLITDSANATLDSAGNAVFVNVRANNRILLRGSTSPSYPSSGAGLEVVYDSDNTTGDTTGLVNILSYDRDGSAYKDIQIGAYTILFALDGGSNKLKFTNTGSFEAENFSSASTGFQIQYDGDVEFKDIYGRGDATFDGDLLMTSGDIETDNFVSGFQGTGHQTTYAGNIEAESMFLRGGLTVYELILNRLRYQDGGLIVGAGGGKVSSVASSFDGTLTASTGSANVTGSGTSWVTDLSTGDILYAYNSGTITLLGTIQTVVDDGAVTLTGNAAFNVTGGIYFVDVSGGDFLLETLTFEDPEGNTNLPFSEGALCLIQDFDLDRTTVVKKMWRQVNSINGSDITFQEPDQDWDVTSDDVGQIAVSDEMVAGGHTSDTDLDSFIYMSAVDSNAPFMRVMDGVDRINKFGLNTLDSLYAQFGNLDSLTSFYSNVSGYGMYSENAFLTGALLVGDLDKATSYFEYASGELEVVTPNLLLSSSTSTQTAYTPTDATSGLVANPNLDSTVTFNDNDLDGTSGTWSTVDETVGWEADRLGSSVFSYNAGSDYVELRQDVVASTNRIRFWQDEEGLGSYSNTTLTFTFTLSKGTISQVWDTGELYLDLYARESGGSLVRIARTILEPSDVTSISSGSSTHTVSAFIKDNYSDLRWAVEFPEQNTSGSSASSGYMYVFVRSVSVAQYDKTQTTLNANGLTVYSSPISSITATSGGLTTTGILASFDDLQVPVVQGTGLIRTPDDDSHVTLAVLPVGSDLRLYLKDSDGTLRYVLLTTSG